MPDQLFESQSGKMVLQSYLNAKANEEKRRQGEAQKRLDIYHDDWQQILEDICREQFHKDNYLKIKKLKNTTQNILRKVVDDVSVVYKVAPQRDFGENEILQEIYEDLQIDEVMKRFNQYGFLCNDLLLRVGWDFELKKITLDILTPANASVMQRDNYPEQAAGIYYPIEYIDSQYKVDKKFVFWSDSEHFVFTMNESGGVIQQMPAENNPDMVNPFNKLPFVIMHMKPLLGQFWNESSGSDLIDSTTITGFKRTMKDYLFKFASFKQLVIVTDDPSKLSKDMLMDPATAIVVTGQGAGASVLDFTAPFEALEKTIQADINATLSTYGLSVDMFTVSPNEMSGKALSIKNRGLQEIRETQLPLFRRVENDLFEMIRLVYNTYNPMGIPETLEFKIDFAELEAYQDPMEERKQAQWDVQNGIISPGQFYMAFNPDIIDEDEAEEKMAENLEKYKNMKNQGFSFDQFTKQDQGGDNAQADKQSPQLTPGNISGANLFGTKNKKQ